MASGTILGICPVCENVIWEDQWDICEDTMIHKNCKNKFIADNLRITNGQFKKLSKEQNIINEIKELKQELEITFKYYSNRINELENSLK